MSHIINFKSHDGKFSCCTESGVLVFNTEWKVILRLSVDLIGTAFIFEWLENEKLCAIVPGNLVSERSSNQVYIFDIERETFTVRYEVPTEVLSVVLRKDWIIIVMENEICGYDVGKRNGQKLFSKDTAENPNGLCVVSASEKFMMVPKQGHIEVYDLGDIKRRRVYRLDKASFKAHENNIVAMSLNNEDTLLATASAKGTIIRIFSTSNGQTLYEFRRGAKSASIHDITFSPNSKYLCSSSNSGTGHIYALEDRPSSPYDGYFAWLPVPLPGTETRSFATFTIPEDCKTVCLFDSHNNLYALSGNGTVGHYKYQNDQSKQACILEKWTSVEEIDSGIEDVDIEWYDASDDFQ